MMKTKKKNKFLTFCFSLLPGAGEMYMGFMRTGVSLMSLFCLSIFVPASLGLEGLIVICVVIWFYGFFHANHLAGLSDEEFELVEDKYLFGLDVLSDGKDFVQKYHKVIAGLLILSGILLLWNTIFDIAYIFIPEAVWHVVARIGNYTPRVVVAIIIIYIGVKMIKGRKAQLAGELQQKEEA